MLLPGRTLTLCASVCARARASAQASHGSYHNAGGLDLPVELKGP